MDYSQQATDWNEKYLVNKRQNTNFVEQQKEMKNRISDWISDENIEKAKGKSREDIFKIFGNELKPIAFIPSGYIQYLNKNITDNRVYSGKGYFIDHAVNHHPEVKANEYGKIQEILDNPDEVKLDNRVPDKTSLIFIKKYNKYFAEVVNVDKNSNDKIVFHKSYYYKEKTPQKSLSNVELYPSFVDGLPTISPAQDAAAVPRNISALNDGDKDTDISLNNQINSENSSDSSDTMFQVVPNSAKPNTI